jgi:uncharacterized protein (DUF1800 family)
MLFPSGAFNATHYFEAYWKVSESLPFPLKASRNAIEGLSNGIGNFGKIQAASQEEKKAMRQQMVKQSRDEIRSLNLMWLDEMVHSPAQLREKIALFWHGHFACRNLNSFYQQQLLQVIRDGALGSFADLLKAVSKSAAMLAFLNNQQNRKQSPNENFAREVMELFTLGRGHYTENDIKEAARAFTGWGFNLNGDFVFRKQFHDHGTKTVLGHTGNLDGDDVLNILLDQPQTARFITTKLYRFLVNEQVDEERIKWLSNRFFESGYEMRRLLSDIFTGDWFYQPAHMGQLIKSPVQLWVGIRRLLPMELENNEIQLLLQAALGQILMYPPSVAGWPGGTNWIDSSSLLLRLRLPQLVAMAEPFEWQPKADDDVNMGKMVMGSPAPNRFSIKGEIAWEPLYMAFANTNREAMVDTLMRTLLATTQLPTIASLKNSTDLPTKNAQIQVCTISIMGTPEYQLC